MSYNAVPNVSSLYRDTRSVSRVFRLLERGQDLIRDKKFSIWNFLKGGASGRQNLLSKGEFSYRVAVARPGNLCLPTERLLINPIEGVGQPAVLGLFLPGPSWEELH